MNDLENNSPIKDKIVAAIQTGKIQMRPKWQFVLHAILIFVGTILSTLVLVYLSSFTIFISTQSHNIHELFETLPWLVIFLAVIFIIILEVLVRKYSFAYKKPLLYSVLGIVALVLLVGALVSQTDLHQDLDERAHGNEKPFWGSVYRHYDPDFDGDIDRFP